MSHSFKCGQFDDAYQPKRLNNWQTPRWDPERPARDPLKFKKTEVIVTDNGHLLPHFNRADRNPWNNFIGTSDMPTVITRAIATDIATRPAFCIEYLDKPNPLRNQLAEATTSYQSHPAASKPIEGLEDKDHTRYPVTRKDYADHDERIQEANAHVKELLKCPQLVSREESERVCRARQLERELWMNRECQRRAEVHQDIQWLKNQRFDSNLVPRQINWTSKSLPPRTGLGVYATLFDVGSEEDAPPSLPGKKPFSGGFMKKLGSIGSMERRAEEEASKKYQPCPPKLRSNAPRAHKVLSEDEEECVPYNGKKSSKDRNEGSLLQSRTEEGGAGSASTTCAGVGGAGADESNIEFLCPNRRPGAPRPVLTGDYIDPNVKDGGYVAKKLQKERRVDILPEHDCSKGCRTPVTGVPKEYSNERQRSPTHQESTQNCDSSEKCQNGGCSPKSVLNKPSERLLRSTENYPDLTTVNGDLQFPQFEDSEEVLRRPQSFLPPVGSRRSDQPDCNPNNLSYRCSQQEDNPNPLTVNRDDSKQGTGRDSLKQACEVSCNILQHNPTPAAVSPRQANLSAPSTTLSLPPTKPPPPTPNVGAQFSLIGDPSQVCQPNAPPQRAPPAPTSALAAAPAASVAAKELKSANLEHQPLADTVLDAGFCRLAGRGHPNPGIALDCVPAASGVGWRPFDAPGPTNCSKQRVYRPHTAGCGMYDTMTGAAIARASRPKTSASWRRHVSQMELAIGWDTIPDFPEDEPRPPKHVDGSNGSAAPGIFCRVPAPERSPALPTPTRMQTPMNHEPSSDEIKARLAMLQRDRAASAAFEACCRSASEQRRRNSAGGDPRNLEDHIGAGLKASTVASNAARRRLPRRAQGPVERVFEATRAHRACEACAAPTCDEPVSVHRLPPAPFKAGRAPVCLTTNSSFNGGGSSGSRGDPAAAKSLNVPRPRNPFSSRGYEITTLAQPFAMDKNGSAGGAYPEHWRLASVYQLSYKPLVSRNKPLMKTVFQ